MSDSTAIQALLFDVFGTVVDWRTSVAAQLRPFLARHNIGADPYDLAHAWRRKYQPALDEIRGGRRPFVRLDVLHRENLESALADVGVDPASIPAGELDELNLVWHRLDPWPDSVPGLRRLKQRFIIAPLSNGNIRLMTDVAKRAGLPWDAILGAEVVQAYKPSHEVYQRTADVLGMRPQEICMVAAHNGDLAAARQCGFRTAFVLRATEYGPNQKTNLRAEQDWDWVVDDLETLATRLGCPA
ncbi:haloacid dehalogenase type II [Bordetella genomosp. 9]|uniref:(S)-2-haloacid dehalogenase n=1 Tax=Bordetella genomosp. 9 TaxID=1416803 RepID=A0A1W6Z3R1_9BORD|nr:haloacid dehalogenase type II [Bordetella genomosp. 9]ARP87784.1 haloacid dehalogenase, type II [Bordetella genomosp. 9]